MSEYEGADSVGRGLPMKVGDLGFLIDKLGRDAGPLQFIRELTQNAIEAIEALPDASGEIRWDVDWNRHTLTDGRVLKVACIDTGTGMTGPEQIELINRFAASMREQAFDKNFGIGAKIAAATRNPAGLIYLSWKDGKGAMTHLWRNPDTRQYELQPFTLPDGTVRHWQPVVDDIKPEPIDLHGTMVILLGEDESQDTMEAPRDASSPSRWLARYLNSRYFRFPGSVRVRAREGWAFPRDDKDRNLLRTVSGQGPYLEQHAEGSGVVELDASETDSPAKVHWYVLKDEKALDSNSGYINSSGHVAALFQDELYEMSTGRAGVARLQLFGVIFGYKRVVLYVEPVGGAVEADTARQRLLDGDQPLPWEEWAAEFRSKLPTAIESLMEEVTKDPETSESMEAIKQRLNKIKELLRLSRYRPTRSGDLRAIDDTVGGEARTTASTRTGRKSSGGGSGGRKGDIYSLWVDPEGAPAEQVAIDNLPEVDWVTVENGKRQPPDLDDRGAKFLMEQNRLLINGDFRGFVDMIDRWHERYRRQPGTRTTIEHVVREWFQQALLEVVIATQALQGSSEWTPDDVATALSEEALTAAVMQRYHIDNAVSRALGSKLGSVQEKTVV